MNVAAEGSAAGGGGNGAAAAAAGAAAAGNAGNPGAGATNGAAPGNGTEGGSNGAATDPFTGLASPENRELVKNKGWTGLDPILASYRELESKIGKALVPPAPDAPPEVRDAFFEKLGRPKTPAEYKFERPATVPESFPYDANDAALIANLAHAAGLDPRQAGLVHDGLVMRAVDIANGQLEQRTAKAAEAQKTIIKEWGEPDSAGYKRNLELANRAITQLGGDTLTADLKGSGILAADGTITAPAIAFAFSKIGQQLFAEDTVYGGVGGFKNPFAKDTENLQEQGAIIKSDPERAKVLMRNAGIDPKEYYPNG
jgi:hypothetical protein